MQAPFEFRSDDLSVLYHEMLPCNTSPFYFLPNLAGSSRTGGTKRRVSGIAEQLGEMGTAHHKE